MGAILKLEAELREGLGKGACRRMRRLDDKIPAIIYGGDRDPVAIMLAHNKVLRATEHETFYSQLLTIDVAGKKEQVILKGLQRHHIKPAVLHMDFQRVKKTDVISMRVPLHFVGEEECPGVKAGGKISHHAIELEVRCAVSKLPEFIEVDVSKLELDQVLHAKDLTLPNAVAISSGKQNQTIISVHPAKKVSDDDAATTTTDAASTEESKDSDKDAKK